MAVSWKSLYLRIPVLSDRSASVVFLFSLFPHNSVSWVQKGTRVTSVNCICDLYLAQYDGGNKSLTILLRVIVTGQMLFQHTWNQAWLQHIRQSCCLCPPCWSACRKRTWRLSITLLLVVTGRPEHQSDVSLQHQHQVGMTTVCLVVSSCLAAPRDSVPGCTSPLVAVTSPRPPAPWLTGHTAAGGWRSKHTHSTF